MEILSQKKSMWVSSMYWPNEEKADDCENEKTKGRTP
jgi:hypothetical protein